MVVLRVMKDMRNLLYDIDTYLLLLDFIYEAWDERASLNVGVLELLAQLKARCF
jgi:hypothetical protein